MRRMKQGLLGLLSVGLRVGGLTLVIGMMVVDGGVAQAAKPSHKNLKNTIKNQSKSIKNQITNESTKIKDEMAAQHDMIQTDIADTQTDIAEVKALVEALTPGAAPPPCGAGTEGQRFTTSADDTEVCDNDTGLYWVKAPDLTERTYPNALTHCAGLDLGNGQTYRLPEIKELISLVDHSQFDPALPAGHPFMNVKSAPYRSETTYALTPTSAWSPSIFNGLVHPYDKSNFNGQFVWCARSGS